MEAGPRMESGFIVSLDGHDLRFEILGERSCADISLITISTSGDVTACVMGRFYYRADIARRIGKTETEVASLSEAGFAVSVYAALGTRSFDAYEGDFALVICDRKHRLLFACRDPMGGFPLFWTQSQDRLSVSTSLRTLRQSHPSATIDYGYIAEYLMQPSPFEQEVPIEATAYTGVSRVLPGCLATFRLSGCGVAHAVLCDWAQQSPHMERLSFGEIVERYKDLLTTAVHERIRGRIGCHYSGGMDSTSVGLIAHRKLLDKRDSLRTYTLTYENLPGQKRENYFIDLAREAACGAIHTSLPGDDWYDFDEFSNDIYQDEPCGTVWQSTMSVRTLRRAAEDGIDTLFTGFGGEEFISMSPYYVADLIKRGQFAKAISESSRLARAHGRNRWHYLWKGGLANLVPAVFPPGMSLRHPKRNVSWAHQNDHTLPSWISRDLADRYRLLPKQARNMKKMTSGAATPTLSMLLFALRYRPGDTLRWTLGTSLGVFPVHPYTDSRLIRYCLSIHEHLPPIIDRQKPVLGDAMAGILPDPIRLRQDKGHFTEAVFRGLARNLGAIESLVRNARIDDLEIFDSENLLECLRQSAAGVSSAGSKRLRLSLYLVKWLAMEKGAGRQTLPRTLMFRAELT